MSSDHILVTGFGPFPGVTQNPSQVVCQRLDGRSFGDLLVMGRVLDVSFQRSAQQLQALLQLGWPCFMLHFGLARSARQIRIETSATNCKAAEIPDIDGEHFEGAAVREGQPIDSSLETSLATEKLVDSLNRCDLPTRISRDAGAYVCNSLYYHSLSLAQEASIVIPSLFVHIPAVGTQPDPQSQGARPWSEEQLLDAAEHIVTWIAERSHRN